MIRPTRTMTRRAVVARINRRLAKDGQALRSATSALDRAELGELYVIDAEGIVRTGVDLEALARELDALKPWERLSKED